MNNDMFSPGPWHKWCNYCKSWVDTEFDKRNWKSRQCPDCRMAYKKEWHRKNYPQSATMRANSRWKAIYRTYGITKEEWLQILADQGGLCKLCDKPLPDDLAKIDTDHSHKTGVVRGLMHRYCNKVMAAVDSPLIYRALELRDTFDD